MSEPWFNPNLYAWIPGTLMGVMGGVLGSLGGTLAPQGKAKGLVLGLFRGMIVVSALLLIVAAVALAQGQPYGIWYGLGLPGLMGTILFPSLLPLMNLRYRQAEERKIHARDALD